MQANPTSTIPTTQMRAVHQRAYGPVRDVIALGKRPVPTPGAGQVLIKIKASSTNALDSHYQTGTPYFLRLQAGLRTPKRVVPGADVAGTVVTVAPDVTEFEPGDEVFGEIGSGGFAEYAIAGAASLAKRPNNLPLDESATLGVAALTALQGLRDWGGIEQGDRVLINGASGGVGTFAIQIAKALGASHLTAVCSTGKLETALSLGADRVIDYAAEDFTNLEDRFDLLFDNAGSQSLARSRRILADDGVFVMITGKKGTWIRPADRMLWGAMISRFWSQRFATGTASASGEDGAFLAGLVENGKLRPHIDRRFTLDEAIEALEYQMLGHARGKSIVVVS